jgi:hypothetical protein
LLPLLEGAGEQLLEGDGQDGLLPARRPVLGLLGEGPSDEIISPVPVLQRLIDGAMTDSAKQLARLVPAASIAGRMGGEPAFVVESHVTLEPQPIMLDGREISRSTERHDRSYYRGVKRH